MTKLHRHECDACDFENGIIMTLGMSCNYSLVYCIPLNQFSYE